MDGSKAGDAALSEFLCFATYSANQAFHQFYAPLLARVGLTYPQYLVMTLLWSQDTRTVGEIGRILNLQSNTMTPLLKRMEGAGLIERRRDTADERIVRISLTAQGRALRDRLTGLPGAVAAASGMTAEERGELIGALDRLRRNMTEAARTGSAQGGGQDAGSISGT
ncbi:MarR family transcriptional regulator [Rhodobacterales bacterium HKCCE2091]|nr:MarR family transcriptional regulator [Rhodobacterales bacterium HKCCE2091]